MTLETRTIKLAQWILGSLTEDTICRLEALETEDQLLKEVLTQRALQSEEDIREGKLLTFEEANRRIEKSLGV